MRSCTARLIRVGGLLGFRELTLELALNQNGRMGFWRMTDNRPLSENEADDRLKAALNALGEAPGVTVAADTALAAARKALSLLSLGLIAAGVQREL